MYHPRLPWTKLVLGTQMLDCQLIFVATNLLITLSVNFRPSISWEILNVCHLLTVRKSWAETLREFEKQTIVSTGATSSSRFRRWKNTAGVRSPGFFLSLLPIVIRNKLTTLKIKKTSLEMLIKTCVSGPLLPFSPQSSPSTPPHGMED